MGVCDATGVPSVPVTTTPEVLRSPVTATPEPAERSAHSTRTAKTQATATTSAMAIPMALWRAVTSVASR